MDLSESQVALLREVSGVRCADVTRYPFISPENGVWSNILVIWDAGRLRANGLLKTLQPHPEGEGVWIEITDEGRAAIHGMPDRIMKETE